VEQEPPGTFSFAVFSILTNAEGEVSLELLVEGLDTLEEIYRRSVIYQVTSPLHDVRCLFRIKNCSFPSTGHYQVSLLADGEQVAQRKLRIIRKEK
jgi:hypothetical protein